MNIDLHPDLTLVVSEVRDGTMKAAAPGANGDDAQTWAEARGNRRTLLRQAGLDPERTACVRISYDRSDFCEYREVDERDATRRETIAARFADDASTPCDALATGLPGAALLLPVADCMPVVAYDPEHRVVALTHLGRHSVEQLGGQRTVEWMQRRFGSDPAQLVVWLGPAPNGQSYPLHALGDRSFAEVVPQQLRDAGVKRRHVVESGIDTVSDARFFSHSEFLAGRQPVDGRYAVAVAMRGRGETRHDASGVAEPERVTTVIADGLVEAGAIAAGECKALSGLSADPAHPGLLYAVNDDSVGLTRVFTLDATKTPVEAVAALTVTQLDGSPAHLDVEGVFARPQGGFWLADEGSTGPGNAVHRVDAEGRIRATVRLPGAISRHLGKWGFEGVTAFTDPRGQEWLFVVIQRPLWADPAARPRAAGVDGADVIRIGCLRVDAVLGGASGMSDDAGTSDENGSGGAAWSWHGYGLDPASSRRDDWVGISEISVAAVTGEGGFADDPGCRVTLVLAERDKQEGDRARTKRIYAVDLEHPGQVTTDSAGSLLPITVPVTKRLVADLLPWLREPGGQVQEKLEGVTVDARGRLFALTDNAGDSHAPCATVFVDLGVCFALG
nr:esterase-like activity of phytase family protein [Pseudoclavibacter sp. 13-3]